MKKRILAIALILVMALGLAACGSSKETNNDEKKETFTVGFDENFPPYGFIGDDGNHTGFDLDLAAEVAKRLDLELVLKPINWDSKDLELESGNVDCIWNGFTKSEERLDDYEWTDAYVLNSQVFVVADSKIKEFSDLAGKVVAVQDESSAKTALEADTALLGTFKELMIVPDYNNAFMNLESGAVDAIAMDVGVAKYQIEKRKANFSILEQELVPEEYAVGFLKGNTQLRDKVQKTLEEMAADGKFAEISTKWFGEDVGIIGK